MLNSRRWLAWSSKSPALPRLPEINWSRLESPAVARVRWTVPRLPNKLCTVHWLAAQIFSPCPLYRLLLPPPKKYLPTLSIITTTTALNLSSLPHLQTASPSRTTRPVHPSAHHHHHQPWPSRFEESARRRRLRESIPRILMIMVIVMLTDTPPRQYATEHSCQQRAHLLARPAARRRQHSRG